MPVQPAKVCILICTCDRHAFLEQLLAALAQQAAGCPVVVVDNGQRPSADVVARFGGGFPVTYDRLAELGLVAARNRALALGQQQACDYLAFIDDDEVPEPGWLAALVGCIEENSADIVTGPVLPKFLTPPPSWVIKGAFFVRKPGTATGNLILRRSILPTEPDRWFNPALTSLGAEDEEFLKRLIAQGAAYAAANDAIVREFVPPSRLRRRYIWGTGLRDGMQFAQLAALQTRSPVVCSLRAVLHCGQKLGFGCNHLLWSVASPWRFHLAVRDFAAAAGVILGSMGMTVRFYGRPGRAQPANAGGTR